MDISFLCLFQVPSLLATFVTLCTCLRAMTIVCIMHTNIRYELLSNLTKLDILLFLHKYFLSTVIQTLVFEAGFSFKRSIFYSNLSSINIKLFLQAGGLLVCQQGDGLSTIVERKTTCFCDPSFLLSSLLSNVIGRGAFKNVL